MNASGANLSLPCPVLLAVVEATRRAKALGIAGADKRVEYVAERLEAEGTRRRAGGWGEMAEPYENAARACRAILQK